MSYKEEDLINNPTPRCACMLLLDVSTSMAGEPIQELNKGVTQLIDEIKSDDFASSSVELEIITFGGVVKEVLDFQTVDQLKSGEISLFANGNTPMGGAIELAIQRVEERKKVSVFAVGIGANADLNELAKCCPPNRPPKMLQSLRFKEFFQWLSQSLSRVSQSTPGTTQVSLPPTDGWASVGV